MAWKKSIGCKRQTLNYSDGKDIVLAENIDGEFEINSVTNFVNVLSQLSDFFGMSPIKTTDIKIARSMSDTLVVLALIDIYRKNYLLNYSGNNNTSDSISSEELKNELKNGFKNGLLRTMVNNFNAKIPPTEEIDAILKKLANDGIVTGSVKYQLSEKLAIFATNFLIPNSVILVEVFQDEFLNCPALGIKPIEEKAQQTKEKPQQ